LDLRPLQFLQPLFVQARLQEPIFIRLSTARLEATSHDWQIYWPAR